jgi:hypothetical protein
MSPSRIPLVLTVSAIVVMVGACSGLPASSFPPVPASPPTAGSPGLFPSLSPSASPGPSGGARGSAAPGTQAGSAGIGWAQILGANDVLMMDVAAYPGGVVLVGGARPASRGPSPAPVSGIAGAGDCQNRHGASSCAGPVAWTYRLDGRSQGVGPLGGEGGALQHVAWTGSGLIALGCLSQPEDEASDCARPVAWTSQDGLSWASVAVPAIPAGSTGLLLRDVAALPGQVVVGGCLTEPDPDVAGDLCSAAVVWRSGDGGRTWSSPELPDGAAAPGARPGSSVSQVLTLATDGSLLVAGGFSVDGTTGEWQERIWASADGKTWNAATVEPAGAESVDHVTFGAGTWLAIGTRVDETRLWRSTDGVIGALQSDMTGKESMGAAVGIADGFVAVGSIDGVPVTWTSKGGAPWDPAAGIQLHEPELVVLGDRLVAVGREGVWLSEPLPPGLETR